MRSTSFSSRLDSSKGDKFTRLDYAQVGLTSKQCFQLIRHQGGDDHLAQVVIGDHSGSVHSFTLKTDSNKIDTEFKTLPGKLCPFRRCQISFFQIRTKFKNKLRTSFASITRAAVVNILSNFGCNWIEHNQRIQ